MMMRPTGTPRATSQSRITAASSNPSLPVPPLTTMTGNLPNRYNSNAFASRACKRADGVPSAATLLPNTSATSAPPSRSRNPDHAIATHASTNAAPAAIAPRAMHLSFFRSRGFSGTRCIAILNGREERFNHGDMESTESGGSFLIDLFKNPDFAVTDVTWCR
jgi:hypothetical protein